MMDRTKVALLTTLTLLPLAGCADKPVLDEAAHAFAAAQQAIAEGDTEQAMDLLNTSIDKRPNEWYYHERAKLHAQNGDDELATADIEAGLELDPENPDLAYLKKELKKPVRSRFKRASPMSSK